MIVLLCLGHCFITMSAMTRRVKQNLFLLIKTFPPLPRKVRHLIARGIIISNTMARGILVIKCPEAEGGLVEVPRP